MNFTYPQTRLALPGRKEGLLDCFAALAKTGKRFNRKARKVPQRMLLTSHLRHREALKGLWRSTIEDGLLRHAVPRNDGTGKGYHEGTKDTKFTKKGF